MMSPRVYVLRRLVLTFLFAVAAAVGGATVFSGATYATDEEADPALANDMPVPMDDPSAVEKGKERFAERCAFCHGAGAVGAKGPCLVCGHFRYGGKSSQIYAHIAGGIPNTQMGAFGTTMAKEEILEIIAFLRDSTKKRKQE
jgi:mono/diheme cytochrome c family protein